MFSKEIKYHHVKRSIKIIEGRKTERSNRGKQIENSYIVDIQLYKN